MDRVTSIDTSMLKSTEMSIYKFVTHKSAEMSTEMSIYKFVTHKSAEMLIYEFVSLELKETLHFICGFFYL